MQLWIIANKYSPCHGYCLVWVCSLRYPVWRGAIVRYQPACALHSSSAATSTVVSASCPPHLANRYKALSLQGTATTAQLEGIHFGHKSEKFGRIFEDSLPYCFCCDKLLQTWWLRIKQIYCLTIKGESPKWVGRAAFHLESLGEDISLPFQVSRALSLGSWPLLLSSKPVA